MCGSTDFYMRYDACHLITSSSDSFMARITRSEAKPGTPHQIIITSIQRCPAAMQGPPNSTCSIIKDLMDIGVMKEPAYTSYDGPCPACTDAENAVKAACHQTKFVNAPIANPAAGGGTSQQQQSTTGEEAQPQTSSSSSKKKPKEHKEHREHREHGGHKEHKSSKKHSKK